MAKIVKNNIDYTSTPSSASMLPYDNFNSGLDATNVQEAIDEIAESGGGGGATSLNQLSDVELTDQAVGQVLKYNGYKWANANESGGSSSFADLTDVSLNNVQNGQVPKYNSTTQKWENANESGGDLSNYYTKSETDNLLDDKADVSDLPDMTDYYDKSETDTLLAGKADTSDVPQNLQDLDNVTISSATTGQVLQYNSGTWVNADAGSANIWEGTQAQYDAIPVKDNDTVYYITDGATIACTAEEVVYDNTISGLSATDVQSAIDEISTSGGASSLSDLNDVSIDAQTLVGGQTLTYDTNTGKWVNGASSVVADLEDLSDVNISSLVTGQILKYNGSNWVNGADAGSPIVTVYNSTATSNVQSDSATPARVTKVDFGTAVLWQIKLTGVHPTSQFSSTDYAPMYIFPSGVLDDIDGAMFLAWGKVSNNAFDFGRFVITAATNSLDLFWGCTKVGSELAWFTGDMTIFLPVNNSN